MNSEIRNKAKGFTVVPLKICPVYVRHPAGGNLGKYYKMCIYFVRNHP